MTSSRRARVWSIRTIVAGGAAVLTTLVVLGVTGVLEQKTRSVLVEEIDARLLSEARGLAVAGASALAASCTRTIPSPGRRAARPAATDSVRSAPPATATARTVQSC